MNYIIRITVEEVTDYGKHINSPAEWTSDYAVKNLADGITIGQKVRATANRHLKNSKNSVENWRNE